MVLTHCIVIRYGQMKWGGHVPCMREVRNTYMGFIGKYEGKRSLEDRCVDRRQLQRVLKRQAGRVKTGCI
jgi:hypothetical protein